jgi:hypothetical protein
VYLKRFRTSSRGSGQITSSREGTGFWHCAPRLAETDRELGAIRDVIGIKTPDGGMMSTPTGQAITRYYRVNDDQRSKVIKLSSRECQRYGSNELEDTHPADKDKTNKTRRLRAAGCDCSIRQSGQPVAVHPPGRFDICAQLYTFHRWLRPKKGHFLTRLKR